MTRTTRLLLLAAVMTVAASASAQDPVTRRPDALARPAAAPVQADPAPAAPESVVLRGHEDWGTNGKLTFTVKRGGSVVMVDSTNRPVTGTVTLRDDRVSGGHSAYSGTAPQVYDVATDRYSIPFAPEYPAEYVYSNDQVNGEWSFRRNPWMTGHTYKSTGYDPSLRAFVFAPHDYTYFFDPDAKAWSRSAAKNPYRPNFYTVTVCATPAGAVVWADDRTTGKAGSWRLDDARRWQPLPLRGELPAKSADQHGLAHDTKRDRLLFFSDIGPKKGNVAVYDFTTGGAKWLDPAGMGQALVPCRETAYLPDPDWVLIGGRVRDESGGWRWLAYDCAGNAWVSIDLHGDDPVGRAGAFNNSMGLTYDPARKLVWAVGQHSHVHALRLDRATARVTPLR